MGAADAARFISQFTTGYGDYTEERKELFKDLTIEDVMREIFGGQKRKSVTADVHSLVNNFADPCT